MQKDKKDSIIKTTKLSGYTGDNASLQLNNGGSVCVRI